MNVIIIGAVAAGTSAAAKARRNREEDRITVYEKDSDISYSGCGMPYFIGGVVKDANLLTPRDSEFFKSKYNVDIFTQHEVMAIYPETQTVKVKSLVTNRFFSDHYDKLIIATGASSSIPPFKIADSSPVFTLRNIRDMNRIHTFIENVKPASAVIVGTGFIGMELCESLINLGINVQLIEKAGQVTPGLDSDMAVHLQEYLKEKNIPVWLNAYIHEITQNDVVFSQKDAFTIADNDIVTRNDMSIIPNSDSDTKKDVSTIADNEADAITLQMNTKNQTIQADMVIIATGVRPEVTLARQAGIEIGITGAIKVDARMQTSMDGIYACGDCVELLHAVTGEPVFRPLGSTANKTGRIAGDCATDGSLEFKGILGTGIFKVFDLVVAQTGLTEREALKLDYDIEVCHNIKANKPEYMGGKEMVIKAVADRKDGRLLGVQIIGFEGVDKRIDVFATAISLHAKVEDLVHLDLAYAPPFSTTKDPVMYTGMILDNAIQKGRPLITSGQLDALVKSDVPVEIIDARILSQYKESHIEKAKSIPHSAMRDLSESLDKQTITVTYCNKGVTGNAAQNILLNKGFKTVFNLSGGFKQYRSSQKDIKKRGNGSD